MNSNMNEDMFNKNSFITFANYTCWNLPIHLKNHPYNIMSHHSLILARLVEKFDVLTHVLYFHLLPTQQTLSGFQLQHLKYVTF